MISLLEMQKARSKWVEKAPEHKDKLKRASPDAVPALQAGE